MPTRRSNRGSETRTHLHDARQSSHRIDTHARTCEHHTHATNSNPRAHLHETHATKQPRPRHMFTHLHDAHATKQPRPQHIRAHTCSVPTRRRSEGRDARASITPTCRSSCTYKRPLASRARDEAAKAKAATHTRTRSDARTRRSPCLSHSAALLVSTREFTNGSRRGSGTWRSGSKKSASNMYLAFHVFYIQGKQGPIAQIFIISEINLDPSTATRRAPTGRWSPRPRGTTEAGCWSS